MIICTLRYLDTIFAQVTGTFDLIVLTAQNVVLYGLQGHKEHLSASRLLE